MNNEFERIKELYERNKILSSEDIGKLSAIIRMLDYRVKQQKEKDIITNLYETMYNEIIKENKENG